MTPVAPVPPAPADERATPATAPHVAIIVQNLPVPFDRRVWAEATALVEDGFEVSVVAQQAPGQPMSERLDGVHVLRYPAPPELPGVVGHVVETLWSLAWGQHRLRRAWARRPFDVFQACNPPDTYVLLGTHWQRRGARFVFDQHDLSPEVHLARGGRVGDPVHRILSWFEARTYQCADHVIVTTTSYGEVARSRGRVAPDRVTVVRNGPDVDRMKRGPADPALVTPGRTLVAYLGMMGPQDGVGTVVHAMDHVVNGLGRDDIEVALLGDGESREAAERLAHERGLADHVRFTGMADRDQIHRYLSTAALGLSPEPRDDFNDRSAFIKVGEYLSYGLPVLAFELRETRRTAGDAAVYVAPDTPQAYGEALVRLVDAPDRREAMSLAGRQRAVDVLSWHEQARRYTSLLRRVATADHTDEARAELAA